MWLAKSELRRSTSEIAADEPPPKSSPLHTTSSPYLGPPHALEKSGHLGLPNLSIRGRSRSMGCYISCSAHASPPISSASFDPRHLRRVYTSCLGFRSTSASEAGPSTWPSVLLAVLISCMMLLSTTRRFSLLDLTADSYRNQGFLVMTKV